MGSGRTRRRERREQERRERKSPSAVDAPRRAHPIGRLVVLGVLLLALAPIAFLIGRDGKIAPGDFGFEIVNTYDHDPLSFTQGLLWHDGHLYESTGQKGHSRLLKVDLKTGKAVQEHRLADDIFAEGLTLFGDALYQVTYKTEFGIVYDAKTFAERKRFRYRGQGWGLTNDGTHIIMSNGSNVLRFLDPETLKEVRSLRVTHRGRPIWNLNELEYVKGEILANIWTTDRIARIDPATGHVAGHIDLGRLRKEGGITSATDVLNGIAYDPATDRLFVTGKWWPKLFEIRLVPKKKI